ncbi:MAG: LPS-assembly protein LptD, partial [Burkholderiaceae bacterium]|nr:LPS-assembly protein LptD [Burkholderiaceae bacterium]
MEPREPTPQGVADTGPDTRILRPVAYSPGRPHRPVACQSAELAAVAFLFAYAAAAQAQTAPVVLKLERTLGAHRGITHPKTPVYGKADRMQGVVDERVQMDGTVELRRDGTVLRGDSVDYLCASDEAKVRGHARLYDRGTTFSGPELDYRLEARSGRMPDASYVYSPRQGRGTSSLIEFLDENHYRLHDATYTNCSPGDDSWWVRAETLDIDREEQNAIGHHATMYFQGVPIISSPYFSMPLGSERRSGVLTPSYYFDSRSGVQLTVPYYWNIAPNYDYTLTPAMYPRWGALLGNEFRILEPTVRGIMDYDVMPYDRHVGRSRDHLVIDQQYRDASGLAANINYNHVSDDRFLTDFSHSLAEAAPVVLPQNESVSYSRTYWNANLQLARNQTLFSLLNPPGTPAPGTPPPYDRVP